MFILPILCFVSHFLLFIWPSQEVGNQGVEAFAPTLALTVMAQSFRTFFQHLCWQLLRFLWLYKSQRVRTLTDVTLTSFWFTFYSTPTYIICNHFLNGGIYEVMCCSHIHITLHEINANQKWVNKQIKTCYMSLRRWEIAGKSLKTWRHSKRNYRKKIYRENRISEIE